MYMLWRALTLLHDLHDRQNLLHVFTSSDEALQHQHLIIEEHVSFQTSHHLQETQLLPHATVRTKEKGLETQFHWLG